MTKKFVMLVCLPFLMLVADRADAAVSDPAASQVQTLTESLLQSMQAGPGERMTERYRRLEPVINQVIGLPLMTRLAVGPEWTNFSPDIPSFMSIHNSGATVRAIGRNRCSSICDAG
jgi:phospholipid transport system substrate-binding protein